MRDCTLSIISINHDCTGRRRLRNALFVHSKELRTCTVHTSTVPGTRTCTVLVQNDLNFMMIMECMPEMGRGTMKYVPWLGTTLCPGHTGN